MTLSEKRTELRRLEHEAKRLRREIRKAKPRIEKPKTPGLSREERRAEHNASTKGLRANVLARSCGKCEACGGDLGTAWDLHHVEGGGLRRSRQRSGNCLALCMECHRRWHRGDLGTLAQIARAPSLDAEARREVLHRIAKIEEARRTPSVPVRIEEAAPRSPSDASKETTP